MVAYKKGILSINLMNRLLISPLFICAALVAPAAQDVWQTDLEAASQQAAKEGKLVLIDFTGSDWCTACIQLRRTVLDAPDFMNWAQEHFVFVEVDLPQRKALPGNLLERNKAIAERYEVIGLPTIMALTPQGRVVGGFLGNVGSTKTARQHLENAISAAAIFEKAAMLQGKEKAQVLMQAYSTFPSAKAFERPYCELRDEIKKNDPGSATGIHADVAVQEQAARFEAERAALNPYSAEYGALLERQLAETLPPNKGGVLMARCQYSLTTADSVEELEKTRLLFEECIPFLSPAEAEETRQFLQQFFADLPSLLNMLRNSRPR